MKFSLNFEMPDVWIKNLVNDHVWIMNLEQKAGYWTLFPDGITAGSCIVVFKASLVLKHLFLPTFLQKPSEFKVEVNYSTF